MSQIKILNNVERAVEDALIGLKCSYPALYVDKKNRIVLNNQIYKNRVALLSGGGSRQDPFCIDFVGNGMLSGAAAGLGFTSSPGKTIFEVIRSLANQNNNSGVLVIVLNYTGDILNFALAVEEASAYNIEVEMVVINEDYSHINKETNQIGICGNCFIFKIAGNMAKCGIKLSYIAAECRLINNSMCTLQTNVSYCTVPGIGPLFKLGPDEIEIEMGVDGKVSTHHGKFCTIDELVNVMITRMISSLSLYPDSKVCVVVNNLGCVSQLEIGLICNKVYNILTDLKIITCRLYNGSQLTNFAEASGFQVSILDITEHPEWLQHLDAYTDAPGWPVTCISLPLLNHNEKVQNNNDPDLFICKVGPKLTAKEASLFERCLCSIANALIQKEECLNELDSFSGDGDFGSTLRQFSENVLQNMPKLDLEYPAECFYHMSRLMQNISGSSGSLYSIFLASASRNLPSASNMDWLKMWKSYLDSLISYSKAKIGDKTKVDVLLPVYDAFYRNILNKKEMSGI